MWFSQDLYLKALTFAARAHGEQKTPVGLPYIVHVSSVAMEVMAALRAEPGGEENLALVCALLHDVLEDTSTPPSELEVAFGRHVAFGVSALTKDSSLDKPTAMRDSLDRILRQPPEVAMVKLADRITNLAPPPPRWTAEKISAYRAEAVLIVDTLGAASALLAARLRQRIARYGR